VHKPPPTTTTTTTSTMTTAEEYKAKGNAALQAGNASEAIEHYTHAINLDGANHVYYSNRSAAYLSQGDANNALEDANACLGLNPEFAKGYSRKGAALHALQRYNDSIAAYQAGLQKFPNDAGLTKGLQDVQREKEHGGPFAAGEGGGTGGGLFGPQMLAQMAMDPKLRPYLNDADLMGKISMIQKNPNLLPTFFQDAKFREMMEILMGAQLGGMDDDDDDAGGEQGGHKHDASCKHPPAATASSTKASSTTASSTTKDEPEEMQVEEDLSQLSPEERKKKETQMAARKKKDEGNELYKAKQFEEALAAYDAAFEIDPTNMTFLNNKAAVYFTQNKWDECIEACNKAVEVGKEFRAPFEERAKALTRAARGYQKKGDLEKAIEFCNAAQLESYDKNTQRLLKTMELEKKKADALAYQDDGLAEEAKQRGNDLFRAQEYAKAVEQYEEAVKRAPKNAVFRNNLAAALCKIMDFSGAQRQIEVALELDPKYVKAWARKGDIEMYMKEYHKAMKSFEKGLDLEPDNPACKEGLRKCMVQINYGRSAMSEEEKKQQAAHAMADPEIQTILTDPVMQQVLRDMQENPSAGQKALADPIVRGKIERLIAAGIIETR